MILWYGRREDGDEKTMGVNHRWTLLIFMCFGSDVFLMEMFHRFYIVSGNFTVSSQWNII